MTWQFMPQCLYSITQLNVIFIRASVHLLCTHSKASPDFSNFLPQGLEVPHWKVRSTTTIPEMAHQVMEIWFWNSLSSQFAEQSRQCHVKNATSSWGHGHENSNVIQYCSAIRGGLWWGPTEDIFQIEGGPGLNSKIFSSTRKATLQEWVSSF